MIVRFKKPAIYPVSVTTDTPSAFSGQLHGRRVRPRTPMRPTARFRYVRYLVAGTGLLALLVAGAASGARTAASTTHQVVFYSVGTAEQYVNNKDDRARGQGANPFGNFHDAAASTKQAKGPFPGDEAVFQFAIYGKSSLGKRIGDGRFICLYNFNQNALCDASYDLPGGMLVGTGSFSFDAPTFNLDVTGGSGKYSNVRGNLEVSSAAHHAQRLSFTLG
jgi:hypothetical protein